MATGKNTGKSRDREDPRLHVRADSKRLARYAAAEAERIGPKRADNGNEAPQLLRGTQKKSG
jgi:hypothetical protein